MTFFPGNLPSKYLMLNISNKSLFFMLINEFRMSYVTPFYPGSALFPLLTARKSSCVVMFWQDFVVIFKDDAISSILSVSQVSKSSRVLCGREVREDAFAHSLICSFASSSGCGWLVRFFVLSLTIFTRYHISLRLLHSTMFCADSYQYFSNTSFRFLHISLISLAFLVPLCPFLKCHRRCSICFALPHVSFPVSRPM